MGSPAVVGDGFEVLVGVGEGVGSGLGVVESDGLGEGCGSGVGVPESEGLGLGDGVSDGLGDGDGDGDGHVVTVVSPVSVRAGSKPPVVCNSKDCGSLPASAPVMASRQIGPGIDEP